MLTQGFMPFADHALKEQMVNILAVLSTDLRKTHIFENVLVRGDHAETVIEIPEGIRGKILAYVLNYNELAYGIFYPD